MPPSPTAWPIARNLAQLAAGRGTAVLVQFGAFAVIAAHLGPGLFGIYAFAIAFAALFRLIPSFGLEPVLTREIAQDPEVERALVPNIVYARVALACVGYLILAAALFGAGYEAATAEAALVAGCVLLFVAGETFRNSLAVRLRLGFAALADIVEALFSLAGVLVLAHAGSGVIAFLWLYVAAKALNAVIVAIAAGSLAKYSWRPKVRAWTPALRAAVPLALSGLLIAVYYRVGIVVLTRLHPSDDVGQYGAAYRFFETFLILPGLLVTVLQPVLARSLSASRDVLERRYGGAVHLAALLGLPIGLIGGMTGWRLLPAIPGFGEFEGAGVALSIISPAAAAVFVAAVAQSMLIMARLQRTVLVISGLALAVNVPLIAVLIPSFSFVGAAVATTITEAFVFALSVGYVRRRLGAGLGRTRGRRTLLAAAITAAALALGYAFDPFVQAALGVLVYVGAVAVTGAVSRADLAALRRMRGAAAADSASREDAPIEARRG